MEIVSFDWQASLLGGALIGVAAVLLMALNGRIAGISGIVGGLSTAGAQDRWWRVLFVLGLIVGVGVAVGLGWAAAPGANKTPLGLVIAAGALVGVGTAIGSGCTSGHGVCGLSRGSARSLVSTLIFMGVAGVVVYVLRHVLNA